MGASNALLMRAGLINGLQRDGDLDQFLAAFDGVVGHRISAELWRAAELLRAGSSRCFV